jgi:hypothetical protein
MAKRDILKEAIADAKAVKEVAIANAKAALEEAFTPKLKSMLSAKIAEMDENDGVGVELDEKKKYSDDDREPAKDEYKPEKDTVDRKMVENEDIDEEVNLDEILAELEKETVTEADESEAERADVDKYEYEEGKEEGEDEAEDEAEDDEAEDDEAETIDLEDMTDEDLKSYIESVIADMVADGELEAGENFEEEETEDVEVEDDVDVEVEDSEEVEIAETSPSLMEQFQKEKRAKIRAIAEVKKLRRALKEAYAANNTRESALKEVKLLNAKLLYTNKIFRAKSLTENEKIKVLSSFDKATTGKEAKLIFETLSEGLKSKRKPIRESLGSASKATGNFKRTKNPIIKTDPMVARFQKLAGLK